MNEAGSRTALLGLHVPGVARHTLTMKRSEYRVLYQFVWSTHKEVSQSAGFSISLFGAHIKRSVSTGFSISLFGAHIKRSVRVQGSLSVCLEHT